MGRVRVPRERATVVVPEPGLKVRVMGVLWPLPQRVPVPDMARVLKLQEEALGARVRVLETATEERVRQLRPLRGPRLP